MTSGQLLALSCLLLAPSAFAQDPSFHASLRDSFSAPGDTYADVWGFGDTAYMGRFGLNELDVIDVTNPDSVSLLTTIIVPTPNSGCSAQDVKVGASIVDPNTHLAFIAFDAAFSDAFGIYDVTTPGSPNLLTTVQTSSFVTSHNMSFREDGWIATCNSIDSAFDVIDLRGYDPASPPASINTPTYALSSIGTGFVHDITFSGDYLFASQWDTLMVYDVSDLPSTGPALLGEIPGMSNHAVWPTADNSYVVSTDERTSGAIRLYEFIDSGTSIDLLPLDSFVSPNSGTGFAHSSHNPVFRGDRCYVSSYNAGVIVFQVDRTTQTFEKVASFDTSTEPLGYEGCWGVYPHLGEERVLCSDMQNGLLVVDFSALQFVSQSARPKTVDPFTATPIEVDIEEIGVITLDTSTVELFVSVDGGPFSGSSMSNVGGNTWQGTLPAVSCGSQIDYYFSADSMGAETFTAPAVAPAEVYSTWASLNLTTVFDDDFSSDNGWTVTNVSVASGGWVRAGAASDGLGPHVDDWRDAGDECYVTGDDGTGGGIGSNDLDGGPTILTSPVLDYSAGDGLISYSGWQASDDGIANDALICQISNGGTWMEAVSTSHKAGGWVRHSFRVSDYVTPNSTVQVRFLISDNPNDSVAEGGVDNFLAEQFCESPAATATFRNGAGGNSTCYATGDPVLGEDWISTITHSGHSGATLTAIVGYASGTSGTFIKGGELLVNLGSASYFTLMQPATGTADTYTVTLPMNVSLAGATTATQGAILGGGYELCNAFDLVLGF